MGPWTTWSSEWQPCHSRGFGTRWYLRSPSTQTILWSFLAFLKVDVTFNLFQTLGISPNCHKIWDYWECHCDLICQPLHMHPIRAHGFVQFAQAFPHTIVYHQKYILLELFTIVSVTRGSWQPFSRVNIEAKKALNTTAFLLSWVSRSPVSFSRGPTVSLVFLLLLSYLLMSLARFNSNSICGCSVHLYFCHATCPYFLSL